MVEHRIADIFFRQSKSYKELLNRSFKFNFNLYTRQTTLEEFIE